MISLASSGFSEDNVNEKTRAQEMFLLMEKKLEEIQARKCSLWVAPLFAAPKVKITVKQGN